MVFSAQAKTFLIIGGLCGPFVVAGFFLLAVGGVMEKFMALLALILFGGGGILATRTLLRNRTVLQLGTEGIRFAAGGLVPWADVEKVGIGYLSTGGARTKIIGIRMNSYDNFVRSLTPAQLQGSRHVAKWGRVIGIATLPAKVDPSALLEAALTGGLRDLFNYDLITIPQQSAAAQLLWSRKISGGWDVTVSPLIFDRKAAKVVEAIERYRQAALALDGHGHRPQEG